MEKTPSLLAQHTFFWLLCPWCLGARCISQANLFSFPNSSSSCNTWLGKVNLLLINIFPAQDHCLPRILLYVKLIYENIAGLRMNHFITFQTKPWVRKEPEGEASHFLSGISRGVCKPCCLECPKILKGCPKDMQGLAMSPAGSSKTCPPSSWGWIHVVWKLTSFWDSNSWHSE